MSNFYFDGMSCRDTPSGLDKSTITEKFCFEIEFSIVSKQEGFTMLYYFIYCNVNGLKDYIQINIEGEKILELKSIVCVERFDYKELKRYCEKNIIEPLKTLNDKNVEIYLNEKFRFIE